MSSSHQSAILDQLAPDLTDVTPGVKPKMQPSSMRFGSLPNPLLLQLAYMLLRDLGSIESVVLKLSMLTTAKFAKFATGYPHSQVGLLYEYLCVLRDHSRSVESRFMQLSDHCFNDISGVVDKLVMHPPVAPSGEPLRYRTLTRKQQKWLANTIPPAEYSYYTYRSVILPEHVEADMRETNFDLRLLPDGYAENTMSIQ